MSTDMAMLLKDTGPMPDCKRYLEIILEGPLCAQLGTKSEIMTT